MTRRPLPVRATFAQHGCRSIRALEVTGGFIPCCACGWTGTRVTTRGAAQDATGKHQQDESNLRRKAKQRARQASREEVTQ